MKGTFHSLLNDFGCIYPPTTHTHTHTHTHTPTISIASTAPLGARVRTNNAAQRLSPRLAPLTSLSLSIPPLPVSLPPCLPLSPRLTPTAHPVPLWQAPVPGTLVVVLPNDNFSWTYKFQVACAPCEMMNPSPAPEKDVLFIDTQFSNL